MQTSKINRYKNSPASVKYGLGFLLGGWMWFLYSIRAYYDNAFFGRFLIGGVVVIACVLQLKKWARILALLSNGMTILYCFFFMVVFHLGGNDSDIVIVSAINVLLFAFSSYFLFLKTSADFFDTDGFKKSDEP